MGDLMGAVLGGVNTVEGAVPPLVNALTHVVGLGLQTLKQLGLLGLL
ncbi:hypothetical protein [Streptomyces sp. NPDC058657]